MNLLRIESLLWGAACAVLAAAVVVNLWRTRRREDREAEANHLIEGIILLAETVELPRWEDELPPPRLYLDGRPDPLWYCPPVPGLRPRDWVKATHRSTEQRDAYSEGFVPRHAATWEGTVTEEFALIVGSTYTTEEYDELAAVA